MQKLEAAKICQRGGNFTAKHTCLFEKRFRCFTSMQQQCLIEAFTLPVKTEGRECTRQKAKLLADLQITGAYGEQGGECRTPLQKPITPSNRRSYATFVMTI